MFSILRKNVFLKMAAVMEGKLKNELFLHFVDLHPHILVKGCDFVNLMGMLGHLVIQFLYIGCSGLIFAVHSDILACK